jgi:uncharacterized protein (TIGR02391 family)
VNLESKLDERFWQVIQDKYGNRDFTGAILDAIYFLSELIREKTGLECDGVALAGQAFGGKRPKLKINKLQTESDKNVQSGVEQLVRGLYQAIRNPRSHAKHNDKEDDADSIILFINYLICIIDRSKAPFTKNEFLSRVFDTNFVEKERYAEILVSEIPPKYRLEIMLDVFHIRSTGDGKKLRYFVHSLFKKLLKDEKRELFAAISEELRTADDDSQIRSTLQIFPPDCFSHLNEAARLRTENRLLKSIAEGKYDDANDKLIGGALGTWASRICRNFLLKNEFINTLASKLSSMDGRELSYVFKWLWADIITLGSPPPKRIDNVIKSELRKGNNALYEKMLHEKEQGNSQWAATFEKEMEAFKEKKPQEEFPSDDDVPF